MLKLFIRLTAVLAALAIGGVLLGLLVIRELMAATAGKQTTSQA